MRTHRFAQPALAVLLAGVFSFSTALADPPNTLKVYLLAGQSNMQGQALTYYNDGAYSNVPSLQFLTLTTQAAADYRASLPDESFTFKPYLDASWMSPRDDVWAIHLDSGTGSTQQVEPTISPAGWYTGAGPLSPGFGASNSASTFGPELGMGINLGGAMQTPVFLFKSDKGGTNLAYDWRPPSAVAARGGAVGVNYTNTVNQFKAFLNGLDNDLAGDGKLNAYNNATGYEVCGFVWVQGWNEMFNDGFKAEYAQNIVDLVHDIRTSDPRIPNDLGAIIAESSDQQEDLNASRAAAVAALNAEIPGSAFFYETNDMIGVNWGDNAYGFPFSDSWGYHFHGRAENFLEIGWKAGQAAIDLGFTGTDPAPEPATIALLGLGALGLLRKRRRARA